AESHLAVAAAALEAQLWGEARRHLEAASANGPSARACRMMAELEEAAHHASAAARRWPEPAAEAPPDAGYECSACPAGHRLWQGQRVRRWPERAAGGRVDAGYQCAAGAAEHRMWHALCPNCGAFDPPSWKVPARASALLLPGAEPGMVEALPPPQRLAAAAR